MEIMNHLQNKKSNNEEQNFEKVANFGIPKVAKFEIVSFDQFKKDMLKHLGPIFEGKDDVIEELYQGIKLPKRSTVGSAGYDFFAPFSFVPSDAGVIIPTGIRCKISPGWVLKLYPRSGQGFKYGVELFNTVGIIDSDYFYTENEGHIMVKMTSKLKCDIIDIGKGFCQGIFEQYGITVDDDATDRRIGGFGSTDKK